MSVVLGVSGDVEMVFFDVDGTLAAELRRALRP
jgi:hypothetical protein